MGPVQAVTSGLLKFPIFTGRATRSEFWWFAPIWTGCTAMFMKLAVYLDLIANTIPQKALFVLVISLPIWSAASRRLQDVGEQGTQVLWPLLWLAAMPLLLVLPFSPLLAFFPFGMAIFFPIAMIIMAVCTLIAFVMIGPIIGQLILPSSSGPNPYGPNPNEVPT